MRAIGESITVPLMALALSDDGDAAAYAPMELGDPSDGEEERYPEDCAEDREVTPAACFKCYRRMKACGFTWAKAEYDWLKERLTEYNVGWISGYAERRAQFLRFPEDHAGETHLFYGRKLDI